MNSALGLAATSCRYRVALAVLVLASIASAQVESLPVPVVHRNSFEILSNSRYSAHSGFTSSLPRQVVSNVLWAMNRMPTLGSYRELYIATPANVYRYDSVAHALVVHRSGDHRYNSGSSYEVGIACDRQEEAGYAIQAGLLAGTAFWDSAGGNVVSCPMQYATNYANSNWNPVHPVKMVDVFGQATATGLVRTVQAVSSDSTLPLPHTVGPDTFEVLVSGLHQDSLFDPSALSIAAISQLLWAGCGVTPHMPIGKRGITIPSAVANYYLTRKVYLVRDTAVHRYNNRLPPGTGLTTSDHRLELVTLGDRRTQLRAACPRIPSTAPAYIVVCVADTGLNWSMQEAGFAGFQYLTQAMSLGLEGFLTAPIGPAERSAIISALGIPGADLPAIVFACGQLATGVTGQVASPSGPARLQAIGNRAPIRIEYSLGSAVAARLTIHDLAGRLVREFGLAPQTVGPHGFNWDGTGESSQRVPAGIYVCRLEAAGITLTARIVLSR
jgi:hypothetical protein